jgi:phosphatidylinositol alpha-1,6-mannosyltransferase
MRVLALVTDAFGTGGGIAQYNRDLLTALAAHSGPHHIVVLPRHAGAEIGMLPQGVRQLAARNHRLLYSVTALCATIAHGPFDFVFCGHLYLSPLAGLVAWLSGAPLWLQLHGSEAWRPPRRAERRAAEAASLITSVSRYTRRRFLSLVNVEMARLRVLANTVGPGFSPGDKSAILLDRYGLHGKRVLLTVGRLDPAERQKGHDRVIAALPAIIASERNAVYLIAGEGADRDRLAKLAEQLGVAHAVVFTGAVSVSELPEVYRLADIFVMPSYQEGFGIVFLEAAASGVPVIAGNNDGSMDALADCTLGTAIDPFDRDALVLAVRQALAGHSRNAPGVDRFSFDNFARHVSDLVNACLLPSPSPELS